MKRILPLAALAAVLAVAASAAAQTEVAPPQATTETAPTEAATTVSAGENWNAFSRSATRVYLTDVNGFTTTGDVTHARVVRVPLAGAAGDYSYAADEVELRCGAKQSRTVASMEYGPDGAQTDRYDEPEPWDAYAPNTRDGYLSQLACDGSRTSQTWPSIKAYVDGGRH